MSDEDRSQSGRLGHEPAMAVDEVRVACGQGRDQGAEPPGLRADVSIEHHDEPIVGCETSQRS